MSLDYEQQYYSDKIRFIAGCDEAGRGCLLGPVVAGAVILPKDFNQRLNQIETLTSPELHEYIDEQRMRGSDNIEAFLVESYKRIAFPFACFILTLIGVTLSCKKVRGGIGINLGVGLALSFSYILFMQVFCEFAKGSSLPPLLAVWIPNIIYTIIGVVLYFKAPK